jgi:hypothetical protein
MNKNYFISQFLDNEYLSECFGQLFDLSNFPTLKLQLQTITERAMCMQDMHDDKALHDFKQNNK